MDGGGSILYFLDIIIIGGCNTIPVIQGSSMKIKIIIIKKMKQTNNNIALRSYDNGMEQFKQANPGLCEHTKQALRFVLYRLGR